MNKNNLKARIPSTDEVVRDTYKHVREIKEHIGVRVSNELRYVIDRVSILQKSRKTTTDILVEGSTEGLGELSKRLHGLRILKRIWSAVMNELSSNKTLFRIAKQFDRRLNALCNIENNFAGSRRVDIRLPEKIRNGYRDLEESTGISWQDLLRLKWATHLGVKCRQKDFDEVLDDAYLEIEIIYKTYLGVLCQAIAHVQQYNTCPRLYMCYSIAGLISALEEYDEEGAKKLREVLESGS